MCIHVVKQFLIALFVMNLRGTMRCGYNAETPDFFHPCSKLATERDRMGAIMDLQSSKRCKQGNVGGPGDSLGSSCRLVRCRFFLPGTLLADVFPRQALIKECGNTRG